jgi:hypothetical protein
MNLLSCVDDFGCSLYSISRVVKTHAMKEFLPLMLAMLIGFSLVHADTDKEALAQPAARMETNIHSSSSTHDIAATSNGTAALGFPPRAPR